MSIDGFIAKDEDNIDFLSKVEREGEDYGYASFVKTVDTVIWGRKTYDKILSMGIELPYKNKKCIVVSRSRTGRLGHVEFYNGSLPVLIQDLKSGEGADIYCDGGGEIVSELLKYNLIDRFVISIIPHIVGKGIRLFSNDRPELSLQLQQSVTFPSGLVQLVYEKEK